MTSRKPLLVVAALGLALAVSACTADPPAGTIAEDDLPGDPEVAKVRTNDDQAGQVVCQAVNDAEDNHLMTPSENSTGTCGRPVLRPRGPQPRDGERLRVADLRP